MTEVNSIGFALDPGNVPCFLLDWEVTKKCNLDCTYCEVGIDGGHDNSTQHPPLDECLHTIDFMYEYVDLYMIHKKPSQRKVVLNIYGGESLLHPNIVQILEACRKKYKSYENHWHLTIVCTTNGIIQTERFKKTLPYIDNFIMSYHADTKDVQQKLYFDNLLVLKKENKPCKAVIMMHNTKWEQSLEAIEFCKTNNLKYIAKPVDQIECIEWRYTNEQLKYFKEFWDSSVELSSKKNVVQQGRPCCGGRKLSINGDLKTYTTFVPKQGFEGWSCSVNWFFLYVQQCTGNIYTNKDCRMSTTGHNEPLGNLKSSSDIIDTLRSQFVENSMPIIQCKNETCLCGICAPKAEKVDDFINLITRNVPNNKIFKI